jgi:hypothetical protein
MVEKRLGVTLLLSLIFMLSARTCVGVAGWFSELISETVYFSALMSLFTGLEEVTADFNR